jgi:hypothetical protein
MIEKPLLFSQVKRNAYNQSCSLALSCSAGRDQSAERSCCSLGFTENFEQIEQPYELESLHNEL